MAARCAVRLSTCAEGPLAQNACPPSFHYCWISFTPNRLKVCISPAAMCVTRVPPMHAGHTAHHQQSDVKQLTTQCNGHLPSICYPVVFLANLRNMASAKWAARLRQARRRAGLQGVEAGTRVDGAFAAIGAALGGAVAVAVGLPAHLVAQQPPAAGRRPRRALLGHRHRRCACGDPFISLCGNFPSPSHRHTQSQSASLLSHTS